MSSKPDDLEAGRLLADALQLIPREDRERSSVGRLKVLAEDFVARTTSGDEPDDGSHRDPHPADARLSGHYSRVTGDARQLWHGGCSVGYAAIVGHGRP